MNALFLVNVNPAHFRLCRDDRCSYIDPSVSATSSDLGRGFAVRENAALQDEVPERDRYLNFMPKFCLQTMIKTKYLKDKCQTLYTSEWNNMVSDAC
jgi:hypothetical protein